MRYSETIPLKRLLFFALAACKKVRVHEIHVILTRHNAEIYESLIRTKKILANNTGTFNQDHYTIRMLCVIFYLSLILLNILVRYSIVCNQATFLDSVLEGNSS